MLRSAFVSRAIPIFVFAFNFLSVVTSTLPAALCQTAKGGDSRSLARLVENSNYPEIIKLATAIIASDPKNAEAYYSRAVAYKTNRSTQYKAIQDLDQAIKLKPDMAAAYPVKAVILHEQQDDELALPVITRACELLPTDPGVFLVKSVIYNSLNRPKEALAIVDKLIQHNLKTDEAHWVRSRSMFLLGRTDEGVNDLNLAVKLNPGSLKFRRDRLLFNSRHKKWALVFEDADYVIANDSHKKDAYERRAAAHVGLKQYKEGIADYKSAIGQTRSDSQMRELHVQLKNAYDLAGDVKSAANEADYIKKLDEDMRPL